MGAGIPLAHQFVLFAGKTGGTWYSTPAAGEGKYWKVLQTIKQVNKTCADKILWSAIRTKNPDCFNGCAQPTNTTTDCNIECFYATLIGPGAGNKEFDNTTLPVGLGTILLTPFMSIYTSRTEMEHPHQCTLYESRRGSIPPPSVYADARSNYLMTSSGRTS